MGKREIGGEERDRREERDRMGKREVGEGDG